MDTMDTMMTLDELRGMIRGPLSLVDAALFALGCDYDGDDEAVIERDGVDYRLLRRGRQPVELRVSDYGLVWHAYRYDAPPRRYPSLLLEEDLYYDFVGFRLVYCGVSWLAYRISAD